MATQVARNVSHLRHNTALSRSWQFGFDMNLEVRPYYRQTRYSHHSPSWQILMLVQNASFVVRVHRARPFSKKNFLETFSGQKMKR